MEIRAVLVFLFGWLLCFAGTGVAQAQTPGADPGTAEKGLFFPLVVNSAPRAAFDSGVVREDGGQDVETATGSSLPLLVNTAPRDPFGTMDLLEDVVADAGAGRGSTLPLIVDTDPGVDDALALVYLFSQHTRPLKVVGIVTVAGNTSVDFATNNVLNILKIVGKLDTQVVMGAAAPIARLPSKTGWFIHGPDGLWGLGFGNPADPADLGRVGLDPNAFYCEMAKATPGLTILALGPLTNLANAITHADPACTLALKNATVVVLGGAKFGGNKTPVTEYNFWQDPAAADIVFKAGLRLTVVPFDAFTQTTVNMKEIAKLVAKGNPAIQFLGPAITSYASVQIQNTGKATLPDAVAAAYMLDSSAGMTQSALIRIVPDGDLTGGQSIIGLSTAERIAMVVSDDDLITWALCTFVPAYCPIAGFDLFTAIGTALYLNPDNAQFVTVVKANLLTKSVLPVLRHD